MRHTRTRRHFKFILSLLLAGCLLLFLEERIEAFVPDVRNFTQARIEEALGNRVRLSIGGIDGGILHPITLNDVRINDSRTAPVIPSLVISSVKTGYRVWDLLRRRSDTTAQGI